MTSYAYVIDGVIIDQRDLDPADIPAHKAQLWRPIVGAAPAYDQRAQTCTGPVLVIGPAVVTRTWTLTDRPVEEVRAEAQARLESARLRTEALAAAGLPLGSDPPDERKLTLYAAKQDWARRAQLGEADAEAYLAGEAAAWALTVAQLAEVIIAKSVAANSKIADIETDRMTATVAIAAAASAAEILAAEDSAIATMDSRL